MLKYQINRRQVQSQRQLLDIDMVEMVDFPSETGDKSLMIFYYPTDKDYKFEEGQELDIQVNCETNNNNDLNSTTYTYKDKYTILKVNQEKGLFTCQADKYYDLHLDSFNRQSVVLTVIEYVQNSTYLIKGNYYSFNERYYKCIKTSDTPIDKSIEELKAEVENLIQENADLKRQQTILQKFDPVDEFSKSVVLDKVAKIINGSSTAEIKEFIDYLTIFEIYRNQNKRDV